MDIVKIKNLTPHPINFFLGDGQLTINPSGMVARCEQTSEVVDKIFNIIDVVSAILW